MNVLFFSLIYVAFFAMIGVACFASGSNGALWALLALPFMLTMKTERTRKGED